MPELPDFFLKPYFLSALFAYLIGAIPTGYWLGKLVYRINIFKHGSRNMGATNVYRVLGLKPFIFTLFIDISKGIFGVLLAQNFSNFPQERMSLMIVAGFAAILGHTLSFWVGFNGGKGVATGLGVFLALAPKASILAFLLFLFVVWLSDFVSLGSMVAALSLPFFIFFFNEGGNEWVSFLTFFSSLIALFIIIKHRANLGRLARGEENRFRGNSKYSKS